MDRLRDFIKEVMQQKHLTALDVEKRSGGAIKDSYISDILKGKTKSMSVDKLNGLAQGLGVDATELFKVASAGPYTAPAWTVPSVLHTIEIITASPDLSQIVKVLIHSKPANIKAVKKVLGIE